MKKINVAGSIIIMLNIYTTLLFAQTETPAGMQNGEFWIGPVVGLPVGAFSNSDVPDFAPGGDLGFVINLSNNSDYLQFGADLGLLHFKKYKVEVNDLRLKSSSTIFIYHFVTRIRMQTTSVVRPYADVMVGAKAFITAISDNKNILESIFNNSEKEIKSQKTFTAFSYGGAIGFTFENKGTLKADVRLAYLFGGKTRYIYPKDMQYDANTGEITYAATRMKRTDMLFPQINLLLKIF